MSLQEYKSGTAFPGVIGRTVDVSSPAWPEPNRAKEDAPFGTGSPPRLGRINPKSPI